MTKLIYCATPSRFKHKTNLIIDFVSDKKLAPLHPFPAMPHEKFEGSPHIGRELSMEFCLRLVEVCDEFWMFGVSHGTLQEAVHAIKKNKPIVLCFEKFKDMEFDPEWEKFYKELGPLYGNPLDKFFEAKI